MGSTDAWPSGNPSTGPSALIRAPGGASGRAGCAQSDALRHRFQATAARRLLAARDARPRAEAGGASHPGPRAARRRARSLRPARRGAAAARESAPEEVGFVNRCDTSTSSSTSARACSRRSIARAWLSPGDATRLPPPRHALAGGPDPPERLVDRTTTKKALKAALVPWLPERADATEDGIRRAGRRVASRRSAERLGARRRGRADYSTRRSSRRRSPTTRRVVGRSRPRFTTRSFLIIGSRGGSAVAERMKRPLRILMLSRSYPSDAFPNSGLWVERPTVLLNERVGFEACGRVAAAVLPADSRRSALCSTTRASADSRSARCKTGVKIMRPRFASDPARRRAFESRAMSTASRDAGATRLEVPFDLIHAHFIYPEGAAAHPARSPTRRSVRY